MIDEKLASAPVNGRDELMADVRSLLTQLDHIAEGVIDAHTWGHITIEDAAKVANAIAQRVAIIGARVEAAKIRAQDFTL